MVKFLRVSIIILVVVFVVVAFGITGPITALAATAPTLGGAENFAVLGATTITNTGNSILNGDLGLYSGTSIVGFFGTTANEGPGVVSPGYAVHQTDGTAQSAQTAATTAYNSMVIQSCGDNNLSGQNLGGKILAPGVYCFTATAQLSGILTLDAQGDPNAVWIFQIGTALTVDDSASVVITDSGTGTPGCNVYWQVGSAATIGTSATFIGTIIANSEAVTLNNGATIYGRAISRIAAVTLGSNTVTVPVCVAPTPINGACGTAVQTYPYTATSFGLDTFCSAGTSPSPDPTFPTAGNSVTWTCAGINDGSSSNCTASVSSAPPAPATLQVVKTVVNDSGRTATSSDFNLYVKLSGNNVDGSPAVGVASPGRLYTLVAGTYVVSEDTTTTYTSSFGDDCNSSGSVTLAAGDTKICTITNDDIAPVVLPTTSTIAVIKTVINDNGRTKIDTDFPLFVNTTPVITGVPNVFNAPASYTISETVDSNYTQSFSVDCPGGVVSLTAGVNKICIITNNDIAPSSGGSGSGGGSSSGWSPPPVPPLIDVVKVPSPLALPAGPGAVTYTYTLRNIGTVSVSNITMVGDTCSPIVLISGDVDGDSKLDVDETWMHTCSTTLTETHTNTVVAKGWANGISATDIASAIVVVGVPVVPPLIHVTKIPDPLTLLAAGGVVTYTEKITNPGTVALSNVLLVDDKCAPMKYISGDINGDSKLDPSETWVYTCKTNLTKTTMNTAIATGEANGLTARDIAVATVVVADVVPALPATGVTPDMASTLWNIVIFL